MLRILGIIFLLFFVLPWVFEYVLRWFVNSKIKEAQQFQQQQQRTQRRDPEGTIRVERPNDKTSDKNKPFGGGDYIEYEEVK
jgi:hypothetical protein